jgi:VCBS repeat-containing protein
MRIVGPLARAAVTCALCLPILHGCGGGGSDSPAPPPGPPANRAPAVLAASVSTNEDTATSARLSATDPDNDPLTFAVATNAQHGAASVAADGTFTYTPASNYSGADTFTIAVRDGTGAQATGTVTVTVIPVNDVPAFTGSQQLVVTEDGSLSTVLAGEDIEGDVITFDYVAGIAHGDLHLSGTGALTYTPEADYYGVETFTIRLIDANGATSPDRTIGITVQPVNDAPVANDDQLRVSASVGASVTIPVLANDVDPDGQNLIPNVVSQPTGGTLSVSPGHELVFTPENGYIGPIEFTYRVNDGNGLESVVASARAVVGPFESLVFLSDYTTPGVREVHLYDGLTVRRVSDSIPAGGAIGRFTVSLDATTIAYTVFGATTDWIYLKRLDGTAPARLVYTSATKSPNPAATFATLNRDATYLLAYDPYSHPGKAYFVVDLATGTTTRLGVNTPQVLDLRIVVFSPVDPTLIAMSGQIGGTVPNTFTNDWHTAYIADAANPATLTQIGRNYVPDEGGSGEGAYFSHDGRYIYYGENMDQPSYTTNQLYYDRQTQTEGALFRRAPTTERGATGNANFSRDRRRMCFAFHEPGVTAIDGIARFWVAGAEEAAVPVSSVLPDTTQCAFASDSRTVIYRYRTPPFGLQRAYARNIDGSGFGGLEWAAVSSSKQGGWYQAYDAMNIAIPYFPDNGVASFAGQLGDFYSIPLDASSPPFLFATNYALPTVTGLAIDAKGTFIANPRTRGAIGALELMSTRLLNYSIPLSRIGETLGVSQAYWLRVWD